MHVYFVRHGETALNVKRIHQSPNTPLSNTGRESARTVAEYLRAVNPDLIVSSEYTRALETARIIGQHTGQVPITNGLFYEIVRPSTLFHRSLFHPLTLWYIVLSVWNRNDPTWRYKDAENYSDICTRARKALAYLEAQSETHESVVVVSHTIFIHLMVAYLCYDRLLAVRDLLPALFRVGQVKNGHVVHVTYTNVHAENVCSWELQPASHNS